MKYLSSDVEPSPHSSVHFFIAWLGMLFSFLMACLIFPSSLLCI